jgi:hypothetical protein
MKAVVGEEALSAEDKLALEFLDKFERQFVGQGARLPPSHTLTSFLTPNRRIRITNDLRVSGSRLVAPSDFPERTAEPNQPQDHRRVLCTQAGEETHGVRRSTCGRGEINRRLRRGWKVIMLLYSSNFVGCKIWASPRLGLPALQDLE